MKYETIETLRIQQFAARYVKNIRKSTRKFDSENMRYKTYCAKS